jgi:hypothetical protein
VGDANANSIVMRVVYGKTSFHLAAGSEGPDGGGSKRLRSTPACTVWVSQVSKGVAQRGGCVE